MRRAWSSLAVSAEAYRGGARTLGEGAEPCLRSVMKRGERDWEGGKKAKVVSDFLQLHGLYSPRNSPGSNTGVGSCSLLQVIFPTQELNPGLQHYRRILYQLSHQGSPRRSIRKRGERDREGGGKEALKTMTRSLNFALKIMEESGKMNHF